MQRCERLRVVLLRTVDKAATLRTLRLLHDDGVMLLPGFRTRSLPVRQFASRPARRRSTAGLSTAKHVCLFFEIGGPGGVARLLALLQTLELACRYPIRSTSVR
jgi:hypothetical protein